MVLWVLVHARVGVLGCYSEPAMTAARWRPRAVFWARGESGEAPARRPRAVEEVGRDAWEASASRRWPLAGPVRQVALHSGGGERKQRSRQEEGEKGLKHNFKKSRDPTVNQQ